MKTVVDIENGRRKINNKMKAFADDFNFKIELCKPRHSFTKGKVESANKFIDWIIPYNNEFKDIDELRNIIKNINKKVNQSVNQTTSVPPILLFQKEKEYLSPLPNINIIESYLNFDHKVKVHKDSMIYYKGNRYSVPEKYINKTVTLKIIKDELHIYFNTELISVHILTDKKINYDYDHYKDIMKNTIKNTDNLDQICHENLNRLDKLL
ncbi:hypothetical protein SAMN05661008_01887 [Alkalithermobacter thermoalcaliphilus JW-YL-7 = DSM 7308]|uniref:Integrase catalytic subunit n=2 Tax=Clostridium paradoxum TaxID=29346 RepID=A0A150FSW8_CLOPD|nr:integrase catalytic subunit [[Clostridium] paradoxum JW-YL-7 = DSM 7308]SHL33491.1 hypothetical protein SAMN05661008_01887 [[Clostridium] paradoxum JW-YL-7 = DSM 7308]